MFAQGLEYSRVYGSTASATVAGCSSAAETSKVGAYGFDGVSAAFGSSRDLGVSA